MQVMMSLVHRRLAQARALTRARVIALAAALTVVTTAALDQALPHADVPRGHLLHDGRPSRLPRVHLQGHRVTRAGPQPAPLVQTAPPPLTGWASVLRMRGAGSSAVPQARRPLYQWHRMQRLP